MTKITTSSFRVAGDDEQIEMEDGWEDMQVDGDGSLLAAAVASDYTKKTMKTTARKKKKLTGPLVPIIKGPYFEDEQEEDTVLVKYFEGFRLQFLGHQGKSIAISSINMQRASS